MQLSRRQRAGLWLASKLGLRDRYAVAREADLSLDDPRVEELRGAHGGQLQPIPFSQTRWYLRDLEAAEHAADMGHMAGAARLMRAARRDAILAGVLSTRTGGLVRLPKRFRGRSEVVQELQSGPIAARSTFDEMAPASELSALAADGVLLGVGVGELVSIPFRDHPVFVRLDPEFLTFNWSENRWYFRSVAGLIPITPGDGRWVLHTPGGRMAPWQHGLWRAVGKAYIRKDHAGAYRDNWEAKLANPARVAYSPAGSEEHQDLSWVRQVMAWGVNTVFGLKPGFDVKLLESNGRGAESFTKTIAEQNEEMTVAIAGQVVTTTGGAGFANADVHKSIRADLIKATADDLAYTVNTQILPSWVVQRFGEEALYDGAVVEWDVTPPKDRNMEAQAIVTAANAIKGVQEALVASDADVILDVREMCSRFAIPVHERAALSLVREAS